jgi:hypothetical protein
MLQSSRTTSLRDGFGKLHFVAGAYAAIEEAAGG